MSLKLLPPPSKNLNYSQPYDLSLLIIKIIKVKAYTIQEFLDYIKNNSQDFPKVLEWAESKLKSSKEPGIFEYRIQIQEKENEDPIAKYSIFKRLKDLKQFENLLKQKLEEKHLDVKIVIFPKQKSNNLQFIYDFFYNQVMILLSEKIIRTHINQLYEFLGISTYTISHRYTSIYEGSIKKKIKVASEACFPCLNTSPYSMKWLIATTEGLGVVESNNSSQLSDILLFDSNFEFFFGKHHTKKAFGLKIISDSRVFEFEADNPLDFILWVLSIKKAAKMSPYLMINRFMSSFPIRNDCNCQCYIDGENYYKDVMWAIDQAEYEVFITDWFFSPQLYLMRPISRIVNNENLRLDQVLKGAGARGVKIYIIIYNEPPTFYQNSKNVMKYMMELHPNINVLRNPGFYLNVSLWSFHEKLCIIDRKIGFMGGLDLAFGRWDTQQHDLLDTEYLNSHNQMNTWPGKDFSNERIAAFTNVQEFDKSEIDKDIDPRMPWHDTMVKVEGGVVHDMSRHFIQTWNFINFGKLPLESLLKRFSNYCKKFQGKNIKKIKFYCDSKLYCSPKIDKTVLNGFLSRSITEAENDGAVVSLYPSHMHKSNMKYTRIPTIKIHDEMVNLYSLKPGLEYQPPKNPVGTCRCQFLRSANDWSLGFNEIEHSIQLGYLELIMAAKNFIYIENQYFVSNNAGKIVKNLIVEALILRIKNAAANKEMFKVMVFLPLVLDNPGRIEQTAGFKLAEIWNYKTIFHGENSLIEILKKDPNIKSPSDYINFYGLRNHRKIKGVPKTEEIYVHSKVMIVDDDIVIMGSANINDRSMLGSRDAEIDIFIEDMKKIDSVIAGKEVKVSQFAHNLRTKLFHEHFDMDISFCADPLNNDLQKIITDNSKKNTEIYREIFRVYPDDNVRKFDQLDNFIKERKLNYYEMLAPKIHGFAVEYPLKWLKDENFDKEKNILPMKTFT